MRLVIWKGSQYDATNLPPHVPARECVPAAEWFAANRRTKAPVAPLTPPEPVEDSAPVVVPKRRPRGK